MEMKEVKDIVARRSRQSGACSRYSDLLAASCKQEMLEVAKASFSWVVKNGIVLQDEWRIFFSEEELDRNRIYVDGTHRISGGDAGCFTGTSVAILVGGARGIMTGRSIAHVYDASVAHLFESSSGIRYGDKALCVAHDKQTAKASYWQRKP